MSDLKDWLDYQIKYWPLNGHTAYDCLRLEELRRILAAEESRLTEEPWDERDAVQKHQEDLRARLTAPAGTEDALAATVRSERMLDHLDSLKGANGKDLFDPDDCPVCFAIRDFILFARLPERPAPAVTEESPSVINPYAQLEAQNRALLKILTDRGIMEPVRYAIPAPAVVEKPRVTSEDLDIYLGRDCQNERGRLKSWLRSIGVEVSDSPEGRG